MASSCAPRPRCIDWRRSWTTSRRSCAAGVMSRNARRSIRHKASVSGTGLHTGAQTEATFLPAPAGQGIVFRRGGLEGEPAGPPLLSEVEAIGRRTPIGKGDTTIHNVEHLLAGGGADAIGQLH